MTRASVVLVLLALVAAPAARAAHPGDDLLQPGQHCHAFEGGPYVCYAVPGVCRECCPVIASACSVLPIHQSSSEKPVAYCIGVTEPPDGVFAPEVQADVGEPCEGAPTAP